MNICFLLGNLTANGGIGRVTSLLANYLVMEPDVHCTILSYYDTKKPLFYSINTDIKLDYLMSEYSSMSKYLLNKGHKKLEEYLISKKIDILVACGALFFPISVLATRKINTRCICWEHTAPELNADYRGQALARKYGIRRSDINIVLTKRSLGIYLDKFKCKNTLQIYNPIDPKVIENADEYRVDSKKIISVGRLSYPKNFELAIDVASIVLKGHPGWIWDIYGEGEDREKLEEKIKSLGLEGQVTLRGQVDNLYQVYKDYSMMIMTSRFEGFPMSLLEGLGNGLPLISFDIDTGPSEIIKDGKNGFLVQDYSAPILAERIERLIEDSDLRIKMSCDSKIKAQEFTIAAIMNQWLSLFRSM